MPGCADAPPWLVRPGTRRGGQSCRTTRDSDEDEDALLTSTACRTRTNSQCNPNGLSGNWGVEGNIDGMVES
eukprot:3046467-Pyramimonas_sp.AAC.1